MKLLLVVAVVLLLGVVKANEQAVLAPSSSSSCGCLTLAVCPCRPQFQTPEIKPEPTACGCVNEPVCGCRSAAVVAAPAVTTQKTYAVTQDSCGCLHLTECACRQFVQPEYKPEPVTCGCSSCPCSSSSSPASAVVVSQDACGCLHLSTCGCRPQYQKPEIKDTLKETIAPEIKKPDANCECEGKPTCGCSSIQIVPANSLGGSDSCGCLSEPVCGCRPGLNSNDQVTILKPFTVGA